MPPYEAIQADRLWWIYGIGLALAACVILARGSRALTFSLFRRTPKQVEQEHTEFSGGVSESNGPVSIFFWLVFLGYGVWSVGYVVFRAYAGP